MTVTLSPELASRVQKSVESGQYESAEALVSDAIERLLDNADENDLDALRAKLAQADAEIERGECIEIASDEELESFMRDVHERGLRRLAAMRKTGTEG